MYRESACELLKLVEQPAAYRYGCDQQYTTVPADGGSNSRCAQIRSQLATAAVQLPQQAHTHLHILSETVSCRRMIILCPALGANFRMGLGEPMLANGIVSGSLPRCNITRSAAVAASGINHLCNCSS
jgi:hypothetical protein